MVVAATAMARAAAAAAVAVAATVVAAKVAAARGRRWRRWWRRRWWRGRRRLGGGEGGGTAAAACTNVDLRTHGTRRSVNLCGDTVALAHTHGQRVRVWRALLSTGSLRHAEVATTPPKRGRGRVVVGSHPHRQHGCTGCHTTLAPRAGNGICKAMVARSRGLCGQTPAVAACEYASDQRSTLVRVGVVAEIASPTLPFDAS